MEKGTLINRDAPPQLSSKRDGGVLVWKQEVGGNLASVSFREDGK